MSPLSTTLPAGRRLRPSDFTLHFLLSAPIIAFVWLYRFLPLNDYSDWMYQGYVLFRMAVGRPLAGYSVAGYPVPNSTGTVLMGLLDLVFTPEVSGKIFITATVLIFLAGSVYLITALDRDRPNPLSYAPYLFVCSVFFFGGYMNYVTSLGLLFAGIGYLVRNGGKSDKLNVPMLAVLSVLIYFSHVLSYAAWLVAVAAFAASNLNRSIFRRSALAVAPSLALLGWYAAHRLMSHDVAVRLVEDGLLARKAIDAARAFCLFVTAPEVLPSLPGAVRHLMAAANLMAAAMVVLLGIAWVRYLVPPPRNERFLALACLGYLTIFILAPAWLGDEWWPGDRFLYPAAWIIFASLGARIGRQGSAGIKLGIKAALVGIFALQVGYLHWFGHQASRELGKVYAELQEDESRTMARLCESYRNQEKEAGGSPNAHQNPSRAISASTTGLPIMRPVFHLPYYLWIERSQPALIFPTGLLLYRRPGSPANNGSGYDAMEKFGERSMCEEPMESWPRSRANLSQPTAATPTSTLRRESRKS